MQTPNMAGHHSCGRPRTHDRIVNILLEREGVNLDQPDTKCGRTPLPLAAENEYGGIAEMFLEREDVNPDQPDTEHGQTALSWVADSGHDATENLLVEPNDIRTAIPGYMNQTPQPLALPEAHYRVMKNPPERDTVSRSFIIASLICLFAFLLYIFPSPPLDIPSFLR